MIIQEIIERFEYVFECEEWFNDYNVSRIRLGNYSSQVGINITWTFMCVSETPESLAESFYDMYG